MQNQNRNAVIKKECHSQKSLLGIFRVLSRYVNKEKTFCNNNPYVEDPRLGPSGMTANLMGFTLIELLVVVLIIGILAAIALPQYNKAVAQSRAAQMLVLLNNYTKALDLYVLQNGYQDETFVRISEGKIVTFTDTLDINLSSTEVQKIINYYQRKQEISFFGASCVKDEDYPYCMINVMGGEKVEFSIGREIGENKWGFISGSCAGYDTDGEILCAALEKIY